MAEEDLSYLEKLPRDRVVKAVNIAGNEGEGGGVLVKFGMYNGTTETLVVLSGPALALDRAAAQASFMGRLPQNGAADIDELLARSPQIYDHDWNAHGEPGRVFGQVKVLSATTALVCEFLAQDGSARRYSLPLRVARFLADDLAQYRDLFEDHRD